MPRIYRTQKQCEQFLVREFLRHLEYSVSAPVWQESPDAMLTVRKGSRKKRIAIEHTEYFHDTVSRKCSPLTRVDHFWRAVQASLVRRLSRRKHMTGVWPTVKFKDRSAIPNPGKEHAELARALAGDIVSFMETHPLRVSQWKRFSRRDFRRWHTLVSLLSRLTLHRWTDEAVRVYRCNLICADITTGGTALSLKYIKSAIKNKNRKATNYNWGGAEEKWLLIAASGANLSNHAGPPQQTVNWADTHLLELCGESPFDRIVLWERTAHWYKWLKPREDTVKYD